MKYLALVFAFSIALMGQKQIDWKPCTDLTDQFQAQVEKFNAEHKDGLQIMLSCAYSGDPNRKRQPEQKILLTANEITHLHSLRKVEHAAYEAMDEYENYLFRTHHVRKREIGDPCYNFVGIIVDTDYITVDPSPMLAFTDPNCP
jgi:hypothetical protein